MRFFKAGQKWDTASETNQTGKVFLIKAGLVTADLASDRLFAAMDHGMWIPADVPHKLHGSHDCSGWLVQLSLSVSAKLSATAYPFEYSALLRELADRMSASEASPDKSPRDYLICELFMEELRAAPHARCLLPWPNTSLRAVTQILERSSGNASLDELCSAAKMSKRTLTRQFRAETGLSIGQWRQRLRIWTAMRLLSEGLSVIAAAVELGFESPSSFAKSFRGSVGRSPSEYVQLRKSRES